ncbi:hypothetical protein [Patulibacter defluvii]|uniref:hypothetical protein n=1 Tax=Patulibacter defluvii TaxID=3095358 RepID=UPI002A757E32|nr:hypothetical protein [Patulibacter sp. DM4]
MPRPPIPAADRRASATVVLLIALLLAAVGLLRPATGQADIYNPTTMQDIPTSYYYPPPAPSYDPPPLYFPPLTPTTGGSSGSSSGASRPKIDRVLGYRRSPKVSRTVNRQMAALFHKRLGRQGFDRKRFLKEADKGTFRAVFRRLIRPLGWSDSDYGDAIAAYAVSSYMIANDVEELSGRERIGAQMVEQDLRARLRKNRRMKAMSSRAKQIATERLNTLTVIQTVQWATASPASRAQQAQAIRQAGRKTFGGDLGGVQLGYDGFEPREG